MLKMLLSLILAGSFCLAGEPAPTLGELAKLKRDYRKELVERASQIMADSLIAGRYAYYPEYCDPVTAVVAKTYGEDKDKWFVTMQGRTKRRPQYQGKSAEFIYSAQLSEDMASFGATDEKFYGRLEAALAEYDKWLPQREAMYLAARDKHQAKKREAK